MNAAELRDKLKSIVRPKPSALSVPSLGEVHVRQFTGAELDYLVSRKSENGQIGRVELVTRALCDEHGVPLIDADEPGALELVGQLPTGEVQLLFEKVRSINGLNSAESPTKAGLTPAK